MSTHITASAEVSGVLLSDDEVKDVVESALLALAEEYGVALDSLNVTVGDLYRPQVEGTMPYDDPHYKAGLDEIDPPVTKEKPSIWQKVLGGARG